MRRLVLLTILAATLLAAQSGPPQVPRKAPEFVVNMVDGRRSCLVRCTARQSRWSSCSPPVRIVRTTAGVLAKVQEEYAAKGCRWWVVTFDQGAQSRVKEFSDQLQHNFLCGYSTQNQVLEFLQIPINEPYFVPVLVFIDHQRHRALRVHRR